MRPVRNPCSAVLFFAVAFVPLSAQATASGVPPTPPATSFTGDADHEVVVVPDCEVAIRFPKQSLQHSLPVRLYVNTGTDAYYFHAHPRRSLQVYEDFSAVRMRDGGPAKIGMECFDPRSVAGTGRAWLSPRFIGPKIVAQRRLDRAAFCRSVGVQAASCGRIRAYSQFSLTEPDQGPHARDILVSIMRTPELVYIFASKDNPQRIAVQVQLTSVAPSVATVNFDDLQYRIYFQ